MFNERLQLEQPFTCVAQCLQIFAECYSNKVLSQRPMLLGIEVGRWNGDHTSTRMTKFAPALVKQEGDVKGEMRREDIENERERETTKTI